MELIIEKLKKIKALAEQGYEGEAQAAKLALEKLLKMHGLTLADLNDSVKKERCFLAKSENDKAALIMCCYKIAKFNSVYGYKSEPNNYFIELTDYEFAELSVLYDFHKRNIQKEFKQFTKDFQSAYQYKHNLFSSEKIEGGRKTTAEEIIKIQKFASEMQDVVFYKQLKQSKNE